MKPKSKINKIGILFKKKFKKMIDSHCHLDHEPLSNNIKDVISRSKSIGINKLLTICTTINGYKNILKLVEEDDMIFGTFGVHPHEAKNNKISSKEIID